jgi:hypothetical protein
MNQYDHIRKNLKDYSVPVDKDKLWANTAHAIPKKRRKRGAFFLLPAGALLIGAILTYYIQSNTGHQFPIHTETFSAPVPTSTTPSDELINTDTNGTKQTTSNNNTIAETAQSTNQALLSEEKHTGNNSIRPDHRVASTKSSNTARQGQNRTSNKSIGTNNPRTETQTIFPEAIFPEAILQDRSAFSPSTDESTQPDIHPDSKIAAEAGSLSLREHHTSQEIAALPISNLSIPMEESQISNPVATRTKNVNRFNVRVMQGYGLTTMDISTDAAELKPEIESWKGNIKSLENLSTTLQASLRLPKGIQLGAGLQYSTLTTQLEYQQTSTEDYVDQGINEIIIDEQGNVQNLVGDVNVNRQTIIHSTRYTSHTRLDLEGTVSIPVLRSFRHETGIWVKAGYNLLYNSKGTTFSPGDQPISFTASDNPYTLSSPFTFGTGISTLYRINPHWMLNASIGYERLRYTHGLYNDQITFHHSIFSLSLGTGYVF